MGKAINDPHVSVEQGAGTLIWLATPLLVSLILRAFAGDGWKDFGLRPRFKGNGKWYILSIIVYPIVCIIVILIGFLSGKIATSAFSPSNRILLLQAFTMLLAGTIMKNLLEEFAFRGYLAPKVYALKLNRLLSHCIVGLVWAHGIFPSWRMYSAILMKAL